MIKKVYFLKLININFEILLNICKIIIRMPNKMESLIEKIIHNGNLLSIIIRANFKKSGITFFTPLDFSQQLGYMSHPKGKIIEPHIHNVVKREIHYTKEVLIIKKGKLKVNFYSEDKNFIESKFLYEGDVILLAEGGHGFEVIEDIEMIEVKQGPYCGEADKTRFIPKEDDNNGK